MTFVSSMPSFVEPLEPRQLWSAGPVPRPDHVVIVVEENRSNARIIGSAEAPYKVIFARNALPCAS